jgi:tRNA modification GTPase
MDQSTIAAIATPTGSGGIGIVKISGPEALKIACTLFRRFSFPPVAGATDDFVHVAPALSPGIFYGYIVDPKSLSTLDEVLLMVMLAPKSHTREDVVEIHMHSGVVAIQSVLELILKHGARLAEPGEFTRRAFLNGRIDLTQAEAVIDMVNARNSASLNWAANQITGALRSTIESVLSALTDLLAEAEATIDFPEEAHDVFSVEIAKHKLKFFVTDPLNRLLEQYAHTRLIKEGVRTIIVGKPNVGKSSLMNCLLKNERAIVSPFPGTTRDYIEAACNLKQMSVLLMDTAGIHRTDDVIENIGIQKACELIEKSDLVLYVVDLSRPITSDDELIYDRIQHKQKIVVMNKADLWDFKNEIQIPRRWQFIGIVKVSALHGLGVDELENMMLQRMQAQSGGGNEVRGISPNLRHKIGIEKSLASIQNAVAGLSEAFMPELLVMDLKDAVRPLEEVLGINVSPDILDVIFSRFCIGK